MSRDVLMAHLWPESDLEQARNLLKVSVYVLRRALGKDAIVSLGDGLGLATDVVAVDTMTFESAVARGDHEGAVRSYTGPFMEGFFLEGAPEFGHWVDRERGRLADLYAKALESLAEGAETRGDDAAAVEWWKARAAHDAYDSRVALRLVQALASEGNRAGALRHVGVHAQLLREELGLELPAEIGA